MQLPIPLSIPTTPLTAAPGVVHLLLVGSQTIAATTSKNILPPPLPSATPASVGQTTLPLPSHSFSQPSQTLLATSASPRSVMLLQAQVVTVWEHWPKWMLEGVGYMWRFKLGLKWRVCVSLYVEMERHLGFVEKGPALTAPGIPDAVKKWKMSRYPWSDTKASFSESSASTVQDHIAKSTAWWTVMQPSA
ncbi:hypothetical protein JAAARDRAFT_187388 [Jaapia argillacea MUCL 33604]|uniref:Uncharacterized protein n=1 Tax=Jaapia argillacea MUCL 33604 TaxID=933084 RepID=A0A067QAC5_9AGAM|nr:hypothetical protein JAAARDRAFT_187388 [Jaapia argillacea MUCL 33604]